MTTTTIVVTSTKTVVDQLFAEPIVSFTTIHDNAFWKFKSSRDYLRRDQSSGKFHFSSQQHLITCVCQFGSFQDKGEMQKKICLCIIVIYNLNIKTDLNTLNNNNNILKHKTHNLSSFGNSLVSTFLANLFRQFHPSFIPAHLLSSLRLSFLEDPNHNELPQLGQEVNNLDNVCLL